MTKTRSVKRRRAGRKRLPGERYANGELKMPARDDGNTITVYERRCRFAGLNPKTADRKHVLDPLHGHSLGRLYLDQVITMGQLDAGRKYEADYREWARTADMPRRTAPAGGYGQSVPGRDDVPDSVAEARQKAYYAVRDALRAAPLEVREELQRVCLDDQGPRNIPLMCAGLGRLLQHYG